MSQEDFKFEHRLGYVERTCLEEEGDRRSGGLSTFNHPPRRAKIMKRKAPKKQKSNVTFFTSEIITRGVID